MNSRAESLPSKFHGIKARLTKAHKKTRKLGFDEHTLFEQLPPAGIGLWMASLKLRRNVMHLQATLQERWEGAKVLARRIARRLLKRQ